MNEKKLIVKVLIENDQLFEDQFLINQKIQVIVNKALAKLGIGAEGRELRREDGTPITDFKLTIHEVGIYNNETLRFFKKSTKPDRDKRFA